MKWQKRLCDINKRYFIENNSLRTIKILVMVNEINLLNQNSFETIILTWWG